MGTEKNSTVGKTVFICGLSFQEKRQMIKFNGPKRGFSRWTQGDTRCRVK